MNKKICIFGTGGFGREVITCLMYGSQFSSGLQIKDKVCFMISDEYYSESTIMGIPVIMESEFDIDKHSMVIAVGDPNTRREIVNRFPTETSYTSVIHPTAIISDDIIIGDGAIITAGTIVTCNVSIGAHCHLNLNTTIGHDCVIGDFFTTAPAVNISGNCNIGECVYFGTKSAIREKVDVVSNTTIGMGGIVISNIIESGVYIGTPVKKYK